MIARTLGTISSSPQELYLLLRDLGCLLPTELDRTLSRTDPPSHGLISVIRDLPAGLAPQLAQWSHGPRYPRSSWPMTTMLKASKHSLEQTKPGSEWGLPQMKHHDLMLGVSPPDEPIDDICAVRPEARSGAYPLVRLDGGPTHQAPPLLWEDLHVGTSPTMRVGA